MVRPLAWLALVAALGAVWPTLSNAQPFPSKPVSIVVPSPPGGLHDLFARAMAEKLAKKWGKPVIVENRVGGNAIVAGSHVMQSAPDGHTLFQTTVIQLSNDLIPGRRVPFDPVRDFTPVIALVEAGMLLVTSGRAPYRDLQELIAAARAKPGDLNYGSFGEASLPHVDTEALSALAGVKVTHIPYKGGPATIHAVLSGEIAFTITGVSPALPLLRTGRLRALAYGGLHRSSSLPDVPTFSEAGFPGFTSGGWFGWLAPAKTPRPVLEKIASDASLVLSDLAFLEQHVHAMGLEAVDLKLDDFARQLSADRESYRRRLQGSQFRQR